MTQSINIRNVGVRSVALVIAVAVTAALAAAAPAGATGKAIAAGPGATVVTVDWQTVSKTSTTENLWVQVTGATAGKVNSCAQGFRSGTTTRTG